MKIMNKSDVKSVFLPPNLLFSIYGHLRVFYCTHTRATYHRKQGSLCSDSNPFFSCSHLWLALFHHLVIQLWAEILFIKSLAMLYTYKVFSDLIQLMQTVPMFFHRDRFPGRCVLRQHLSGAGLRPALPVQPRRPGGQEHPALQAPQPQELHLDLRRLLRHDGAHRRLLRLRHCRFPGTDDSHHQIRVMKKIHVADTSTAHLFWGFWPYHAGFIISCQYSEDFLFPFSFKRLAWQSILDRENNMYRTVRSSTASELMDLECRLIQQLLFPKSRVKRQT